MIKINVQFQYKNGSDNLLPFEDVPRNLPPLPSNDDDDFNFLIYMLFMFILRNIFNKQNVYF